MHPLFATVFISKFDSMMLLASSFVLMPNLREGLIGALLFSGAVLRSFSRNMHMIGSIYIVSRYMGSRKNVTAAELSA